MTGRIADLSPEERKAFLDSRKKEQIELAGSEKRENARWNAEIAMLEARVKEQVIEMDLGGGDKIAIRACISEEEMGEIGILYSRWGDPRYPEKEQEEVLFRILELTTANPLLTADYFRENRGKYATVDILNIIIGFLEKRSQEQKERVERVKRAVSFRRPSPGPDIRAVPPGSGSPGSEGDGGSPSRDP